MRSLQLDPGMAPVYRRMFAIHGGVSPIAGGTLPVVLALLAVEGRAVAVGRRKLSVGGSLASNFGSMTKGGGVLRPSRPLSELALLRGSIPVTGSAVARLRGDLSACSGVIAAGRPDVGGGARGVGIEAGLVGLLRRLVVGRASRSQDVVAIRPDGPVPRLFRYVMIPHPSPSGWIPNAGGGRVFYELPSAPVVKP